MSSLFDLRRVAIVTGGNGGIGLGMAHGLVNAGASVVVAARNADRSAGWSDWRAQARRSARDGTFVGRPSGLPRQKQLIGPVPHPLKQIKVRQHDPLSACGANKYPPMPPFNSSLKPP